MKCYDARDAYDVENKKEGKILEAIPWNTYIIIISLSPQNEDA